MKQTSGTRRLTQLALLAALLLVMNFTPLGYLQVGPLSMSLMSIPVAIGSGEDAQTLQDILDGIMPGMLGMLAFWLYYWLLSKKINPMVLIVATMAVGIVGAFFGVLA